jgi:hypothetical protein
MIMVTDGDLESDSEDDAGVGHVDYDALIGLIGREVVIVMSLMIIVKAMLIITLLITIVRLIWIYLWLI